MSNRYASYDEYGFRHLPRHLSRSGRDEKLQGMLFEFDWLRAKLNATDTNALIVDYDLLPNDPESRLAQDALRLSMSILAQDKMQLAGQLLGRLLSYEAPAIKKLLEQVKEWKELPWLRPLTPNLTPSGTPLIRTFRVTEFSSLRGPTLAAAETNNGNLVLLSASGSNIILWDVHTGQEICTLSGHTIPIEAVAMTPDGRRAVSATQGSVSSIPPELKLWDIATGQEIYSWSGDRDSEIADVAITPDGCHLFVAFYYGYAVYYTPDVDADREEFVQLAGEERKYRRVVVSKDGNLALTNSYSDTNGTEVIVWNVKEATGRQLCWYPYGVSDVAISPSGELALFKGEDKLTVKVWDLRADRESQTLRGHLHPVSAVTITHDSRLVISADSSGLIKVWNGETGQAIRSLPGHSEQISQLTVTPDNRYLFSASTDGVINVWDLNRGQNTQAVGNHADRVSEVAITPDGTLAVSASADKTIKVWEVATRKEIHVLQGHQLGVNAVAITPDGRLAISASDDKTVKVWELVTGREIRTLRGHMDKVNDVAVTKDGRLVLSVSGREMRVWQLHSGREIRTLLQDAEWSLPATGTVTITEDGATALASANNHVRVWDINSGQSRPIAGAKVNPAKFVTTPAGSLAIFAGPNLLASVMKPDVSYDLLLWDVPTDRIIGKLCGHTTWPNDIAVTPDGKIAVSVADDKIIRLWDLIKQKEIAKYYSDTLLSCCAVAANSSTVILAGDNQGRLHWLHLEGLDGDSAALG